ncbi:MAG: ATP-grasp domain-containing protein, partial [Sneathiellales bacterium]|nr:ATP-grasp domain-containing protein [Sneathiellales bacterium]
PGYQGKDQSEAALEKAAHGIGVPLLIKASAGGGGRGMRLVEDLDDFSEQLALAQREAKSAFGDPAVLLERFVGNARHVEVQILGDTFGNVVHLFERDCSIQRNHQKIIEEAPAPNLPTEIREKMCAAAVSLCQKIGYFSAGTVEYMYEPARQEFYFLEMNTRLQVEHPVTEAITNIDLAEQQIRIARGEQLSFTQADIKCSGWSIEARVAAEDPSRDYMPETGLISLYQEPSGDGIRVDSGVRQGSTISHYYDSMLSKVIVSAKTREDAIRKLSRALKDYFIAGIGTNRPFLGDILDLTDFKKAEHHTQSLSALFKGGWNAKKPSKVIRSAAAVAIYLKNIQDTKPGLWSGLNNFRVTSPAGRASISYFLLESEDAESQQVTLSASGNVFEISIGNEGATVLTNARLKGTEFSCEADGIQITGLLMGNRQTFLFGCEGEQVIHTYCSLEEFYLSNSQSNKEEGDKLFAPMPGLITDILVREGDEVMAGETLIIFEAMKLMQKLTAPASGTVSNLHIQVGDTPEKGALLVSMETEEA